MKNKIIQMVDAYWKFDNEQQPISSWHDKQDLLKALEELLQQPVQNQNCDKRDLQGFLSDTNLDGRV